MSEKKITAETDKRINAINKKGFFRKLAAFIGPAYLVSVGYMDPGNWATDIAGGSQFGYKLIWIILLSNIMAIIFQGLSARLGIITGKDLAQASSSHYPKKINYFLWILAEIAIISTDIAEVLGTAIGISLIFKIPIIYGVFITGFDTLLLLFINRLGIRKMEAFIILLIFIIGASFLVEIFISKPDYVGILDGFIPSIPNSTALYIGIGIIGATIMPHNLYLHSSLVQTRKIKRDHAGLKQAIKFNLIDSVVALNLAFLVNAAILIVAAATFWETGNYGVGDILTAHRLLEPILGSKLAPILFGIALIAAGQSSTITGTYAGQVVMEGYIHLRLQPWVRRLITRMLAIIPALFVILVYGEDASASLLILSQVILSLQLSFAVIPLIHFVSSKKFMKKFVIKIKMKILSWFLAAIIVVLNIVLVVDTLKEWFKDGVNFFLYAFVAVAILILVGLLVYIIIEPFVSRGKERTTVSIHHLTKTPLIFKVQPYNKIALALDFTQSDQAILSNAVQLSDPKTEITLVHVAKNNRNEDVVNTEKEILDNYVKKLQGFGYDNIKTEVVFGKPNVELPKIIRKLNVDLAIFGSLEQKKFHDLLFGTVFDNIKHKIDVPMLLAKFNPVEKYKRIALALDFSQSDQSILSQAIQLSDFNTQIVLMHIVESAGAAIYSDEIEDQETNIDQQMLENYAKTLNDLGYMNVETEIGFGKPNIAIPKIVDKHNVDLVVFGSHGHKGFGDLLFGSVTDKIQSKVDKPMLIAKFKKTETL